MPMTLKPAMTSVIREKSPSEPSQVRATTSLAPVPWYLDLKP